ncbi:hypothetical protein CPB83DRAFT_841588 [Crepidotus variabilis]|uniref:Uncharacterized protein n=1 Tax=Crepidotus variabilis TaxID=179855 RepID=A0A9P6EUZ2_9AGAR|nr:hypothetical protein CPB83DRAFT_841588 [Crepidotus variabilis]
MNRNALRHRVYMRPTGAPAPPKFHTTRVALRWGAQTLVLCLSFTFLILSTVTYRFN